MKNILNLFFILFLPVLATSQGSLVQLEQVLDYSFNDLSDTEIQLVNAQIDAIKRQNGLRFQSSFTRNDYSGIELGDVWRLSAGFNFNFLQFGLKDKRHNIKSLEKEKEILEIEQHILAKEKNYPYVYNYIIYSFNKEKRKLLEQKIFLLESLINKNYNLYYNHELNFEEILYLKGLLDESKLLMKSMEQVDQIFESIVEVDSLPKLNVQRLPLLEISIDSLLAHEPFQYLDKSAELKKEQLDEKFGLADEQTLNVFFNAHYRPSFNETSRTGVYNSFGIRYSTPLDFNKSRRAKVKEWEKQRIDDVNSDMVFNHNKELINLILDYNSKLRQYTNFNYKLSRLKEKRRVEGAVQKVSTHDVESKKNWQTEIEILNVRYELMGIKELVYLAFLRITNKAKLDEFHPFVKEIYIDEGDGRFSGNRILKLVDQELDKINNEFTLNYLEKNNVKFILWLGSSKFPEELEYELYKRNLHLLRNITQLQSNSILTVPMEQFNTRMELELWVNQQIESHEKAYFFFENIEELLLLDSKTLGE